MTEPAGQQRHTLCFLSTLLSQKVPEKSDAVLRCMIAGQPKPEVTWYKNGQAIDKSGQVSSYEFFENQYIHLLRLSCCTQSDAAIYHVLAKSHLGVICCSASLEVEHLPEDPQGSPGPGDGSASGGKPETETQEEGSAHQADERGRPCREEESLSPAPAMPAGSVPSTVNRSHPWQILASHDIGAASFEKPPSVKAAGRTAEAPRPNDIQAVFSRPSNAPESQAVYHCGTAHATVSGLMGGGLGEDGSNEEVFASGHPNAKVQKYISFSLPLSEANICASPGDSASAKGQPSPQVSSDSDSDYELCPEISLTCTEEFSDDELEYLECSDVMTDHSNALWQRSLQRPDCVFLLESYDEEVEFSECGRGGWEPFLSEMGRGPQVSDDTGPKDAAAGFWGYHSQLQEVGVGSSGASRHSPSPLHTGMTLALGPHQDGTAMVTEPGRCPLPTASEAAGNDYSGIQGETRDNHEAEEDSAHDHLLTRGEAASEGEVKPLSGGLDKAGVKQALESPAEERSEERHPGSRRGAPRPSRMRRPGAKGNAKKLLLKESALEDILQPPSKEHAERPLAQSTQREAPHAEASAPSWNSHFRTEQCASPTPAEQDPKALAPPADSLSKEGGTSFEEGGMLVSNLFEMSQAPEQSDDLQMRIRETFGETGSPSQKPPFSMAAGEASSFTGTTTDFLSNLEESHGKSDCLACLGLESCARGLQWEDGQSREGSVPGGPWAEAVHEQSAPESSDENMPPTPPLGCLPQDVSAHCRQPEALSAASLKSTDPSLAPEHGHSGSRGRAAACVMECFEAGDQGTCYDTLDPPVGTPVDKYLPPETCPMDFELTEGQSKVRDLCSSDKTLAVLSHPRGSEPPRAICEGRERGNSAESTLLTSTFTQAVYLEAREGAAGGSPAEGENSLPISSSTVQDGQEWPSLLNSGGLLETQSLSFENSSLGPLSEGVDERPIISASDAPDAPASHSWFPQEPPTALTADSKYLQVTREVEDPSISVTTNVSPTKYQAISISENDLVDSAGEGSHGAHALVGSTNESTRNLLRLGPSVPRDPGHILQLPGEEGLSSNPLLENGDVPGEKSQAVARADSGRLDEDFQEKGSESEPSLQAQRPHWQPSLSAKDFQESLPSTSGMQEDVLVEPPGHTPASPREEGGRSSDLETSMPMVMETSAEDHGQSVSHGPSLAANLLGEKQQTGLGSWEAGSKVKVIILDASHCEIWPPRQVTESERKEAGAGALGPGGDWALSNVLTTVVEPGPLGVASWAHSRRALDNDWEPREADPAGRDTHRNNLPSQCPDQPRVLESSVDPAGAEEVCVLDSLSGALTTGGKEGVNTVSQVQEENQPRVGHPAFGTPFLNVPGILESSVDAVSDQHGTEAPWSAQPRSSESTPRGRREGGESADGSSGQRAEAQVAILQLPHPRDSGEAPPDRGQGGSEQEETKPRQHGSATMEAVPAVLHVPRPGAGGQRRPRAFCRSQAQGGGDRSRAGADFAFPTFPRAGPLAVMTRTPAEAGPQDPAGQGRREAEPGGPRGLLSEARPRSTAENTGGEHVSTSSDLALLPSVSSPEGHVTHRPISHSTEEPRMEGPLRGETEALSSPSAPTLTPVFISRECESEKAPELLQDVGQKGSTLGNGKRSREEKPSPVATQTGKFLGAQAAGARKKQETSGSGHLAEGMKKKILSKVAALRLRLEEKENVQKSSALLKKMPKLERSLSRGDEKREPKKATCKREGKAPVLLKKTHAEMAPDRSGNVRLSCRCAETHEDSTIWWTKDSQSIAQVQRSAGDNSSVSLAIVQAGQKDQGLYYCGITNSFGKVSAEFNLTAEVLSQLSGQADSKGCEEIEFSQLIFREDFLKDSYFGDRLRGQIATEELHFGEGVHRKAFRSTVMRGLLPVFPPGHACVLKVHNAVAQGTGDSDELVRKNYKLAAQECYVQNTARHYAKIYAAEAQPLEGFGEVPEIIPIFLIHRPENNIPYATVEEELIGEFVKYSVRDGKEINFRRRDSEAGQKCCTFQHWLYQKTSGCLLVTDMQGVGMKLTDVGIATLAKGYKGFKGNCSMTFIDQFKALHQCNKYCKMLGLKSLQNNSQKPRKPSIGKSRVQTHSPTAKTPDSGAPAERKT